MIDYHWRIFTHPLEIQIMQEYAIIGRKITIGYAGNNELNHSRVVQLLTLHLMYRTLFSRIIVNCIMHLI